MRENDGSRSRKSMAAMFTKEALFFEAEISGAAGNGRQGFLVYEASLFTSMVNLDRLVWLHKLGETEEARYRPLPMYAGRCLAASHD